MNCPFQRMGSHPVGTRILSIVAVFSFLLPSWSEAGEYNGRLSLEDLYVSDTSSALDRHQLTYRIAIDSKDTDDKDKPGLHLDVTIRKKISGEDSSSDIKDERINVFNLEYKGLAEGLYFAAGRLWPKEFGGERVDGFNLLYRKGIRGIGFFGGARPDPYTDGFNSGFTTAGAYLFYNEKDLNANLAFVHNGYKGKTDRQYIYSRLTWHLENVHFFSMITADRDERGKRLQISNGIAELTFQPGFDKSITLGYNEFRALTLFESMNYQIDSSLQRACYIRGHYHFFSSYVLYGKYEKQYLEYESAPRQEAHIRQIGFSNNSLFGTSARFDINTIAGDREETSYRTYAAELSLEATDQLQLTLNGATTLTEYSISNENDKQNNYGITAFYRYNKSWRLLLSYEQIGGENYTSKTGLSKLVYRF